MDTFLPTHSMRPFLRPAKKAGQVAHHKQSWAMLIPAYYTLTFSPPARWGCLDFNNGATFLLLLLLLPTTPPPPPPPPCRHLCLLSAFSFSLCQLDVTGESVKYAWTISIYSDLGVCLDANSISRAQHVEGAWTRLSPSLSLSLSLYFFLFLSFFFLFLFLVLFLFLFLSLSLSLFLSLSFLHTKRNLRWKM